MTKELLKEIENDYWNEKADPIDMAEVFDLAIKALEQEPCDDCISRAEALKVIEKEKQGWEGSERYAIDECHTRIKELPSVTPSIPDVENDFNLGYNSGYADAMFDISEGSDYE